MQDAETSLEYVHYGIVDAFPLIDDLIVMHSSHDIRRAKVVTVLLYSLLLGLRPIPCRILLVLRDNDQLQEFNMSRREEVETSIDVYDALTWFGSFPRDKLAECALFIDRVRVFSTRL